MNFLIGLVMGVIVVAIAVAIAEVWDNMDELELRVIKLESTIVPLDGSAR